MLLWEFWIFLILLVRSNLKFPTTLNKMVLPFKDLCLWFRRGIIKMSSVFLANFPWGGGGVTSVSHPLRISHLDSYCRHLAWCPGVPMPFLVQGMGHLWSLLYDTPLILACCRDLRFSQRERKLLLSLHIMSSLQAKPWLQKEGPFTELPLVTKHSHPLGL